MGYFWTHPPTFYPKSCQKLLIYVVWISNYKHFDEPTHPLYFLRNKSMAPKLVVKLWAKSLNYLLQGSIAPCTIPISSVLSSPRVLLKYAIVPPLSPGQVPSKLKISYKFIMLISKVWVKKGPTFLCYYWKNLSFRAKLMFKGCYWIVLRINLRYNTSL